MNNKMCLVYLGAFLLAVHLISSPVVQAQNTTTDDMNQTMTYFTMMPNSTMNTTKDNGCGRSAASSLLQLLPLAVAASLLHGWS